MDCAELAAGLFAIVFAVGFAFVGYTVGRYADRRRGG